jgi:hypothetical protein
VEALRVGLTARHREQQGVAEVDPVVVQLRSVLTVVAGTDRPGSIDQGRAAVELLPQVGGDDLDWDAERLGDLVHCFLLTFGGPLADIKVEQRDLLTAAQMVGGGGGAVHPR